MLARGHQSAGQSTVTGVSLWLRWGFFAAHRLPLAAVSGATPQCGARASHCGSFSRCRAQGAWTSVTATRGPSSHSSQALEHFPSRCAHGLCCLPQLWDLPGSGIKLVSLARQGRFFTTEPPGKPLGSL